MNGEIKAYLEKLGIDPTVLRQRTYVLNPTGYDFEDRIELDPYKIGEDCLWDLIGLCKSQNSNNRQGKVIDIAEQLIKLYSFPDPGYACKYLSKLNKAKYAKEFERCVKNRSSDDLNRKKTQLSRLKEYLDEVQKGEVQLSLLREAADVSHGQSLNAQAKVTIG